MTLPGNILICIPSDNLRSDMTQVLCERYHQYTVRATDRAETLLSLAQTLNPDVVVVRLTTENVKTVMAARQMLYEIPQTQHIAFVFLAPGKPPQTYDIDTWEKLPLAAGDLFAAIERGLAQGGSEVMSA